MNKILLLLSLAFIQSNALAYEKAQELLWACKADPSTASDMESMVKANLDKSHCFGYITGMLDGVQLVFGIKPESKFFCPPVGGMSTDQQVRIVIKHLEDNPQELHSSARMQALLALAKAFPCE